MSKQTKPNLRRKFKLRAKNSSGEQVLIVEPFSEESGEKVGITLVGIYDYEDIQIDFDVLDRDKFADSLRLLLKDLEEVE